MKRIRQSRFAALLPLAAVAGALALAGCGSSSDVSNAITDANKQIKKATKEIQKQGNKALNKAQKQGNKTLNEAQKQLNKAQKKLNKKVARGSEEAEPGQQGRSEGDQQRRLLIRWGAAPISTSRRSPPAWRSPTRITLPPCRSRSAGSDHSMNAIESGPR